MKVPFVLVSLLMILILPGVVGCAQQEASTGQLKILSHHLTSHGFAGSMPQSTATVTGRAQNVGTTTIAYAQIAVNYYDKNGNFLATSSAIRQSIGPGEFWDYTVLFQGPDAWKSVKYDIDASTR